MPNVNFSEKNCLNTSNKNEDCLEANSNRRVSRDINCGVAVDPAKLGEKLHALMRIENEQKCEKRFTAHFAANRRDASLCAL